jgi:hypothetical protein
MPFQKGHKINLGRKFSLKAIKKIKLARKRQTIKHSEKTKKKISLALKGKPSWKKGEKCSFQTRQRISRAVKLQWDKGLKYGAKPSLESRIRMSKAQQGEKGSNWQGGLESENKAIRKSLKFRLWRERIFKRDNWTCQNCNIRGGMIHPHHVKPFSKYPKLRFRIYNGITLCKDCHQNKHKKIKLSCQNLS